MDQETQRQIQERLNSLPLELQQAIDSADVTEKITAIAKKNNLLIDQSESLYTEIFLAMLGVTPLADLSKNVMRNVNVPLSTAVSIDKDVNDQIFLPIREALQKIQAPQEEDRDQGDVSGVDREQILDEIENPVPTPERKVAPIIDPALEIAARSATDGFVADKLANPTAAASPEPEPTFAKATPTIDTPKPQSTYADDPYREPLN